MHIRRRVLVRVRPRPRLPRVSRRAQQHGAQLAVHAAEDRGGRVPVHERRLRGDDALWSWGAREWWRVGPTGEPDASLARPEYARYDEAAESDDDDDDDGYDYGDGTPVATRLGIA